MEEAYRVIRKELKDKLLSNILEQNPSWHCCLIKITQRSQEEMMKKASSIEFVAD